MAVRPRVELRSAADDSVGRELLECHFVDCYRASEILRNVTILADELRLVARIDATDRNFMKPVPRNVTPRLVDPEPIEPTDLEISSRRAIGNAPRPRLIDVETWFEIGKHIVFAALLWPIVVAMFLLVGAMAFVVSAGDFGSLAGAIGIAIAMLFGSIIFAAFAAMVVTIIVLSLLAVVLATLQISISPTIVGALAGGFIGGGVMSAMLASEPVTVFWLVVLATVMGSYGGAIGGWRSQWPREFQWYGGNKYLNESLVGPRKSAPIRFSIRHMLIASTWLCGLLSIAKVSGLLTPQIAMALGIWLAIQAVVMVVGYFAWPPYTRWRVRRWERRQAV